MARNRRKRRFVIAALVVGGAVSSLFAEPAQAIVGRPWTPMSYAGVARRTTRRSVAYGAAVAPYGAAVVAPYPAPVVAAPVVTAPAPVRPVVVW